MRKSETSDRRRGADGRARRGWPLIAAGAAGAALLAAALVIPGCDRIGFGSGDRAGGRFWNGGAVQGCPRPASLTGSGFGDQEREIRHLRREAFRGDFFAQLELGGRYAANRTTDQNIADPIESSVWYAMALTNGEGYAPINAAVRDGWSGWRPLSRYDDCRAWERRNAYRRLDTALSRMSREEQDQVRDRVIYILSTQDADGFRTLARLHDEMYGPFGEPIDNGEADEALRGERQGRNRRGAPYRAVANLFPRNDVDAYLYNYMAVQTGDVGAYVLLKDFERSQPRRAEYASFVESKARRWVPPFEFYPPTEGPAREPRSGVPFSDESRPGGDQFEAALSRMSELPFVHVGRALRYLGVTDLVVNVPTGLSKHQVETLEAMLGHPMEGRLSNLEMVRAIQLAATQGSSEAQLVLAVMYSEGIGVPADYARAFHWFQEADRQGSPEAKFAMSTYFALGVAGVADQDKAQAVAYRMESALSGFKPSAARIQAVLAQVSRAQGR